MRKANGREGITRDGDPRVHDFRLCHSRSPCAPLQDGISSQMSGVPPSPPDSLDMLVDAGENKSCDAVTVSNYHTAVGWRLCFIWMGIFGH
jgi:hypothetical protein